MLLVKTKLAALVEQMKAIHYANQLYWSQKAHSRAAEVEYQWRQERLEQVRKQLEELALPDYVDGSVVVKSPQNALPKSCFVRPHA